MTASRLVFALVSLLIGGLEYSDPRTLNGPFLLDDQGTIKFHSYVWEKNATFAKLWTTDFWGTELASAVSHKSWRPLVTWSFRLQSGQTGAPPTEPFWYHVVNVCLHAANSLLAYLCARNFFPSCAERERLAFLTALLFAAHPIHTEAVSNITGRAEEMCSFFFLLGFVIYAAGGANPSQKRDVFTIISVMLCTFLALISKEQGILLPAICGSWDILYARTRLIPFFCVMKKSTLLGCTLCSTKAPVLFVSSFCSNPSLLPWLPWGWWAGGCPSTASTLPTYCASRTRPRANPRY